MPVTDQLEGRSALVTGSSRGIGRAIAETFRNRGARVLTHGYEPSPPDPLEGAAYLQADLIDPAGTDILIDAAFNLCPTLDTLVSNAGSFFDTPFLEVSPEIWEKTIALNLRAPYFLAQRFAQRLAQEQRAGSIVVVASTNGLQAEADSTAYDISKGGLVMLTRTLAVALAPHGIRVNAVAPGLIRTPLTEGWISSNAPLRKHYERSIPLGRIGVPSECAGAAAFLASSDAAYVTGHILVVDGGLTALQIGPAGE